MPAKRSTHVLQPYSFRPVTRAVLAVVATVSLSLLLVGCGDRSIGTGVVLWSPDETLVESGRIVTIVSQSDMSDSYTVDSQDIEDSLEIARWRVEFFETEEAAIAFAAEYSASFEGNTTLYARAKRNALPIRSEPTPRATNTVYRLREGEEVKLVGREPEETDLEGLVSYWYEALTVTGERGWVFGYTLEVFDPTDASVVVETGRSTDPLIDLLLQNVWRPIYFLDMISNGAIDLDLFRPEYGIFPDPENHQLELVLPDHATIFEYEAITRVGSRRYIAEGTTLQITFQRNDELSIQYTLDDQQHTLALQRVPGEIDEYIQEEIDRRTAVYDDLMTRGPVFRSDNYGELTFGEDQRFSWTGYGRLVPQAIPPDAGETGRVDLGLFLSNELTQQFDGALSFRFDRSNRSASFLYTFRDGGIRLVWVPPENIDTRLVLRPTSSPLTIFMSSTGG